MEQRVFDRETDITVHLDTDVAQALRALAKLRGVAECELIREWVLEKLHTR